MSLNHLLTVVALLLTISGLTQAFQVDDCPGSETNQAEILSFTIDSCPDQTAERCTLYMGKNITLTGEMVPKSAFTQATIKLSAKVGWLMVPIAYDGPKDACGNYGFTCPAVVGQKQRLRFSKKIKQLPFPIETTVRFEIDDQNSGRIICKQAPVQLVNS